MNKTTRFLGYTLLIVSVICGLWFIASVFSYHNPLKESRVKKTVVLEFIDKNTFGGVRVYAKDDGIYDVNVHPLPELQRGDTVEVIIYQHQIVHIN